MSNLYLEIIKCFVEHVDVNIQGPDGKTALHHAVESNDLDLVNLLFSRENANPFVVDNSGKSPWSCVQESEVLEALINRRYGQEQDSLLHLATIMGETNAVRYLIRRGMNVNAKNALQHTPLHLAAGLGTEEIINILVQEGKAEIDGFDARNQTPMHYAVNNKKLGAVKLLLKLGADVNAVGNNRDSTKLSSIHLAVNNVNYDERDLCFDIVKCLINTPNSKINVQDYENKTPLHYADKLKTVEILLTREDIDPLIKDDYGKTPFDYVKNQPEIKKILIDNKYGSEKNSLLHLAAIRGNIETVRSILKEKVDINILNDKGRPAIYLAAEKGYLNVVKLLLKKGADPGFIFDFAIETHNLELLRILLLRNNIHSVAETNSSIVSECVKVIRTKSNCNKAIKACTLMLTALVVASLIVTEASICTICVGILAAVIIIMLGYCIKESTDAYYKEKILEMVSESGLSPILTDVNMEEVNKENSEELHQIAI